MSKRTTRARYPTSKRRRPRTARFFQVVSRLLIAVCIVVGGGAIISKASRPYVISHGESREIRQIENRIGEIEADNEALRRDIEYLQTPQGMEVGARRLGWVKEDEVVVVIEERKDEIEREQDGSDHTKPFTRPEGWINRLLAPQESDE